MKDFTPIKFSSPETARDRAFVYSHLVAGIVLAAAAIVPNYWRTGCGPAFEGLAHSTLQELSQATKLYELDCGSYPPGDGNGSAALAKRLGSTEPKRLPYVDLRPDRVDRVGNIKHPFDPDKVIFYRYPGLHNPKTFDLWCADSKGRADGINNWD